MHARIPTRSGGGRLRFLAAPSAGTDYPARQRQMSDSSALHAPSSAPDAGPPQASSALVEQAFTRASGAPLVRGNAVRILKDAAANYPAWLAAIRGARNRVYFENYIIEDDEVGRELAAALSERARAGVRVRLVRDWMGSWGGASRRFWRALKAAGVDVRLFNAPRIDSPLGWLSRDHRKTIAVDGEIAFVTGLCVSHRWLGNPKRGIAPWRDTGVEIRGPAVAYVERAFAEVWATTGDPIPADEFSDPALATDAGDVPLRIVAGTPRKAGLFRLDQLIASAARRTLWLTDAYFVGFGPTFKHCAPQPRMASTSACSCRAPPTSRSSPRSRGRGIGRCSRRACASSSGTDRCCMRRPRSPMGGGPAWAHRT